MGKTRKMQGNVGLMENFAEINGVLGEKWRLCTSQWFLQWFDGREVEWLRGTLEVCQGFGEIDEFWKRSSWELE
jgi:hypothetical protein